MTHRARVGYLVTGLVCVGIAVSWLLHETGTVRGDRWLFPTVLLGAGVAGLVVSVIGSLMRDDATPPYAMAEPPQPQPASGTSDAAAPETDAPAHD